MLMYACIRCTFWCCAHLNCTCCFAHLNCTLYVHIQELHSWCLYDLWGADLGFLFWIKTSMGADLKLLFWKKNQWLILDVCSGLTKTQYGKNNKQKQWTKPSVRESRRRASVKNNCFTWLPSEWQPAWRHDSPCIATHMQELHTYLFLHADVACTCIRNSWHLQGLHFRFLSVGNSEIQEADETEEIWPLNRSIGRAPCHMAILCC